MTDAIDAIEEGIEILVNLSDSIQQHGNYSPESTLAFIGQALQCFREALAATPAQSSKGE